MSVILAFLAVPWLSASGIYNPPVTHHGRCLAEPGSFEAIYCSGATAAAPTHHRYTKKAEAAR
jgi:hypothetical protein